MQLTTGSDLNTEPTVSPDGEWVAYASDRSGEGHLDIWLQRLSGGEPIAPHPRRGRRARADVFADGSRIAFHSGREGGGIYVIPAHSNGEARLARPRRRARTTVLAGRTLARVFDGTGAVQHGQRRGRLWPHLPHPVSWRRVDAIAARLRVGRVARSGLPTVVTSSSLPDARINEDLEWWIVAPDGLAPVKISGFNMVTRTANSQCDLGAGSRETASSTRRRSGATAGICGRS